MRIFILSIVFFLANSLYANEIQTFTSYVYPIKIDANSSIEKIFMGEASEYYENSNKYLSAKGVKDKHSKKVAATYGLQSALHGGGAIGFISTGIIVGAKMGYDYFVEDNEYLVVSLITNSDGNSTLAYTLIVANNSLSKNELEKYQRRIK